jgi:spore coat polysaccharide biosynthesis predicted glycosyltransferase SpsG
VLDVDRDLQGTIREAAALAVGGVIVDSYSVSTAQLTALKKQAYFVAVLDDLANQPLPVDVVINGTAGADKMDYAVGDTTTCLLGSQHILLRPEFIDVPPKSSYDEVRRILVTLGGGDRHELSSRVVDWIAKAAPAASIDVVIGPFTDQPADSYRLPNVSAHRDADMVSLMRSCDIAVSGGGQTTYELAATGTPAIAIRMAPNQSFNLEGLRSVGVLLWAGDAADSGLESQLLQALRSLLSSASLRREMSDKGRRLVDGRGAARVARQLVGMMYGSRSDR